MLRIPILSALSIVVSIFGAFLPWPVAAQGRPLMVAATVGMIADVAANVGGECVEVTGVMGSGVDPHVYQASARDVRTFQNADIILYSGYSLEGQLGEVLAGFSRRKPTLAVTEAAIDESELIVTEDAYGIDPHLWMDVSKWSRLVPVIAQTFTELRPECAELIENNARDYTNELDALHRWVAEAVETIPPETRILVTAHDAFSYYGRAYGIEVAGIQGISTESEAGVADIRRMARLVADRKVPAVFVETTINPRTIQAVIDAARQLDFDLQIGAQLYSDAMGAAGSAGGTYIGMIFENTRNIVDQLGGRPPPLPPELEEWASRWGVETGAGQ